MILFTFSVHLQGDWRLLHLLAHNMNPIVFGEFVVELDTQVYKLINLNVTITITTTIGNVMVMSLMPRTNQPVHWWLLIHAWLVCFAFHPVSQEAVIFH